MKVTTDNVNIVYVEDKLYKTRQYLLCLIDDIEDINNMLENQNSAIQKLFIDWQDYHNDYSAERTDPCPDYYGYFSLRFEQDPSEMIGGYMTIEELDNAICLLYEFVQAKK